MMLSHWQKNSSIFLPFWYKSDEPVTIKRVLPPPSPHWIFVALCGGLVGIAGRRRPAIPYQAFNLTQTTTFNPKTG
ncbi:MAG: hypothetical protein A2030_03075 [Chloroflexi bacterium RBG_19FT_COMBO_50_10]|nr:MAG: hypothetical protein A2030_03075 [Chloroflexi bacterium RBG_19FT_COMBO_50_10]